MKIKRMTATFGNLDHETLELEEGLNILTLPNEGGKSTWCAFLRVMLYGLNTRERDKKGFLADKSRYQPWSGAAMEGELLCQWQDREVLIRRYQKGSTPMAGFEAIDTATGAPVPELRSDNVGDLMIGVSREVFERSAFLRQSALRVSQTPELEKHLAGVVSSGEEGVSASQVGDTLSEWRRKRQYHTKGAIPTLEARRGELVQAAENARDVTAQIRTNREKIDRYEDLRAKLKHQIYLYEAKSANTQAEAYQQAEQTLKQARDALQRLEEQMPRQGLPPKAELERGRDEIALLRSVDAALKQAAEEVPPAREAAEQAKTAVADPVFSGSAQEARSRARTAQEQISELERQSRAARRNRWLLPLLCIVPAVAAAAVNLTLTGGNPILWGAAVALVVLGSVLALVFSGKAKKCAASMQALLEEFHAGNRTGIGAAAEDYCLRLEKLEQAEQALERSEQAQQELQQRRDTLWSGLRALTEQFAPEVSDVYGFAAAFAKGLTLLEQREKASTAVEHAQQMFDAVAAHGRGMAGVLAEEPTMPLEQAQKGLEEADRRLSQYQSELDMARGYSSAKGGVEAVQAEIESIDQKLEHYRLDYEALGVALEALGEADAEMRNRFSPELNRRAGSYFSFLTDSRYGKVRLNRELEAGVEETGGVATRDVLSLSQGTADQLWLAVRLAVCDLAMPKDMEPCPLVLDDALVNFDDVRLKPALELLEQLARQRQILLFTCHEREQAAWKEMPHGA